MIYLGINGGFGGGYQDASVCFLQNGKVLFAAEEERFNRIKFSPGVLPFLSIKKGIDYLKISATEIGNICLHGVTWEGDNAKRIKEYLNHHFGINGEVRFYHHHVCHAASTFFASGFEESLVITMDSSGDGVSTQISKWNKDGYVILDSYLRPQSLGFYYSMITQYCGFKRDADEYKLMGLAPYAGENVNIDLSFLLNFSAGKYFLDEEYLNGFIEGRPSPTKQELLFNSKFEKKIGFPSRKPGSDISEKHIQLAAAGQKQLEKTVIDFVNYWINLCDFCIIFLRLDQLQFQFHKYLHY